MENKIKIVIAQDENSLIATKEYFERQNNFIVVGASNNGNDIIDLILKHEPDVVVLDFLLLDKDGLGVLDYIMNKLNTPTKPKTIMLSSLAQDAFMQKALKLGLDYFMLKPCNLDEVKERIIDTLGQKEIASQSSTTNAQNKKQLEEKISTIFLSVGIPANIKGYQFLREAVKLTIEHPQLINAVTKGLYPSIAERFETSASKVERAIRHAIEVAWNRGKVENINTIFGIKVYGTNEKPTNSEFIALIADRMLLEGA